MVEEENESAHRGLTWKILFRNRGVRFRVSGFSTYYFLFAIIKSITIWYCA